MSTTKVLILAALLRDRRGVSRLSADERALATAAITQSDNQSILDLFSALEQDRNGLDGASTYATELLRNSGDLSTTVTTAPPPAGYATTFGQTAWRSNAEAGFFRYLALGCLLQSADTAYILGLMRHIEPSESWGLGAVGFHEVAFKGGWGPEPAGAYGVRQSGIVGSGPSATVVAITVDPAPSFRVGAAVITDVARWLRAHLLQRPHANASCAAAKRQAGPR